MIRDLGIVQPGTTLIIPFHTFDSNDPSASVTLSGLAVTDIEVYKGSSTTQRASDNGYALLDTDGIDVDGITGIHGISIDLADNSTAGFWEAGQQYTVVISSVTIDAATINFIACTFRIGYQGARLNTSIASLSSQTSFTLTAGPAEDDALNGDTILFHDVASAVQTSKALILDYTGATKTVTLAAAPTFTIAATDNVSVFVGPANLPGALPFASGGLAGDDDIQTLLARIGTPTNFGSGATLADNFDDIEALVDGLELGVNTLVTDWADGGRLDLLIDAILDDTGTSGVVVNAAGLAADAASEIATAVWASVTRTLTAIDEDSTTLDLDATIRAAVGLAAANLDTQLDALPTAAEITTAVWAAASRTLTALDEDTTTLDLDATIAAAFTAAVCNKIADHILRRDNANAEASANGDTLDVNSLYGIIQQLQLSNTVDNAGFLTIYKTDGTTELAQLALAVDASADPTTGIG
jgi:hypothetical protein